MKFAFSGEEPAFAANYFERLLNSLTIIIIIIIISRESAGLL